MELYSTAGISKTILYIVVRSMYSTVYLYKSWLPMSPKYCCMPIGKEVHSPTAENFAKDTLYSIVQSLVITFISMNQSNQGGCYLLW